MVGAVLKLSSPARGAAQREANDQDTRVCGSADDNVTHGSMKTALLDSWSERTITRSQLIYLGANQQVELMIVLDMQTQ